METAPLCVLLGFRPGLSRDLGNPATRLTRGAQARLEQEKRYCAILPFFQLVISMNRDSTDVGRVPSLTYSLWFGALGFCLAALLVFATVAFAEHWMFRHLGFYGAYATWTVLFILVGGLVLSPLVTGRRRSGWFQLVFGTAFLAYAVAWMAAYFTLRGSTGEWIGSLAGSVLMGLVLAVAFDARQTTLKLIVLLCITNCAGYFLGAALFYSIRGSIGMLLYGLVYGLFMGAGLGMALYLCQVQRGQAAGALGNR